MELWIASEAERDLVSAVEKYREQGLHLAVDFICCIDATMILIRRSPQLFRKRRGEARMAMTHRFPYAVYFIWDEPAGIISIRRILHFAQNAPDRLD
jgi:hypothetical protein